MNLAPAVAGLGGLVEIGRGGFGAVYRAVEHDLGRLVAVKILFGMLDASSSRRFERECRAMGRVAGHPHVVTVHRAGRTDAGLPFIVMELMEGGSLQDRLRRDGVVGWADAVRIGMDIASALEMAHSVGVCHRDVKPGNVLVSSHGVVKLADFGMAAIAGSEETRSGVVGASLAHVAPEVLAGIRPDARADVYSLGSTLHELMRGTAPFRRNGEDSLAPMLARIVQDLPPSLAGVGVPPAVAAVVERAMAKDPAHRPASAGELRQELERAQAPRALVAAAHRTTGTAHRTTLLDPTVLVPPALIPQPRKVSRLRQPALQRDPAPELSPGPEELAPPPLRSRSRGVVALLGAFAAVSLVLVAATVARFMTGGPLLPAPAGANELLGSRDASTLLVQVVTGDAAMSDLSDYDRYVSVSDTPGRVQSEGSVPLGAGSSSWLSRA